jgi:hypothetical protein
LPKTCTFAAEKFDSIRNVNYFKQTHAFHLKFEVGEEILPGVVDVEDLLLATRTAERLSLVVEVRHQVGTETAIERLLATESEINE